MSNHSEERTSNAESRARLRSNVPGWGADLDPANRPAVPKEKPSNVRTPRGDVPQRQVADVKIHKSIEHPDLTPVFGTTCPPKGLSGALRDIAYKYSEGRLAHWMTLMLADRVDVIEGLIDDMVKGHPPDIAKERGMGVQMREDGPAQRRVLAAAGVVIGVAALAMLWNRRK